MRTDKITLREYAESMVAVFGDNAKVAMCFLVAACFKDIIMERLRFFPILHLHGPRATGKTEMGRSLASFFTDSPKIIGAMSRRTAEELADALSDKSNVIVHLDDYKNDIDLSKERVLEYVYQGQIRYRNTVRRTIVGVAVTSGQELPDVNGELFKRMAILEFPERSFQEDAETKLLELYDIRNSGLTHLPGEITKHEEYFRERFTENWEETLIDMEVLDLELVSNRKILENWAVALSAFHCLEDRLDLPFTYQEARYICRDMCVRQNALDNSHEIVSKFWTTVGVLAESRVILAGEHYKVLPGGLLNVLEFSFPLELDGEYLFVSIQKVARLYERVCRASSRKVITPNVLWLYLEQSPEFLGTVSGMTYKRFAPAGREARYEEPGPAMVFDYGLLVYKYDLDLKASESAGQGQDYEGTRP